MDKQERQRAASKEWRAANRERHRASVRAWRLANPDKARERDRRAAELRKAKRRADREARRIASAEAAPARAEARRQRDRARYAAKGEKDRERSRKWRAANPGKGAVLQKAWRERNREKVLANKRARKTAKRITLVRDLTKLQRGRCAYCRVKLGAEFHIDHVMPLKRGGPDKRSNLQLACVGCNSAKAARDPIEFARSTGRLL